MYRFSGLSIFKTFIFNVNFSDFVARLAFGLLAIVVIRVLLQRSCTLTEWPNQSECLLTDQWWRSVIKIRRPLFVSSFFNSPFFPTLSEGLGRARSPRCQTY